MGLEYPVLRSVRFAKHDSGFVASGNYPGYGNTLGSDDSEVGKALRRVLGIKSPPSGGAYPPLHSPA